MSPQRVSLLSILLALLTGCTTLGVEVDPEQVDFVTLPVGVSDYATVHLINRGPERTAELVIQPASGPYLTPQASTVVLPQDVAVPVIVQVHGEAAGSEAGELTASWDGG